MIHRLSHVYSPENKIEQIVCDAFHSQCGRQLTMYESIHAVSGLLEYRGLLEKFKEAPEKIANDIFSWDDHGPLAYYPCDLIQLRSVLRDRRIVSNGDVTLFSSQIAKKYLQPYPVLIGISKDRIDVKSVGGMHLCSMEVISLEQIPRIYIRQDQDQEKVDEIDGLVSHYAPEAAVHLLVDIPFYKVPKVASLNKKHRFEVSIDGLDIHEFVKTDTPEDAVEQALFKKWRSLGNAHRDPKYYVDYWKNTPYWETIVKVASSFNLSKTGEVGSNSPAYPELTRQFPVDLGIKQVKRKTPAEMAGWSVGQKVRRHYEWLASPDKVEGIVREIDPAKNLIFIRWDGWKMDEVISLEDTTRLAKIEKN